MDQPPRESISYALSLLDRAALKMARDRRFFVVERETDTSTPVALTMVFEITDPGPQVLTGWNEAPEHVQCSFVLAFDGAGTVIRSAPMAATLLGLEDEDELAEMAIGHYYGRMAA